MFPNVFNGNFERTSSAAFTLNILLSFYVKYLLWLHPPLQKFATLDT